MSIINLIDKFSSAYLQAGKNRYVPEVMKLAEQYPYSYQNVYYAWLDNDKDIKKTEEYLHFMRSQGY